MNSPSPGFAAAVAEKYALERELGRGGMAVVYLASDLKHGRRVAIKVMAPHVASALGPDRFLREIEIAARLNHPHILPLFDSGVADGQLYYVMPYIDGESLRGRLGREPRLPLGEALRLTREIAGALNHAHAQGLVHRDVKPENVLLSDGIPLVADFGIAHTRVGSSTPTVASSPSTADRGAAAALPSSAPADGATQADLSAVGNTSASGAVVGTPLYMAPEQVRALPDLDGRADLYALGCVFFELLAGEPPFRGRTSLEILEQQARDEARDVTTLRPDVPEDVAKALSRALAKDPADRFPGMAQFIEALNAAAVRVYALAFREGAGQGIPNNLPIPTTSFIGRERELAELKELLRKTRLLSLTGSGGTGKTRLSLQVSAEVLNQYSDGVWQVELAPISDPGLVPKAVANALEIRETTGESITQSIVSSLRSKRLLLVLDNCEHIIEAAAQLVEVLLKQCPELRVMVSSREALGIPGEVAYKVPSLAIPDPKQPQTPESLESYASARLFVERASAAKPDFAVTPQNAPALASVCRRLDGMPLAIELAAARVRSLPLEQIEARLDSRFRLLTGGSRTALPRQQTLRALIDWSYDLLKDPEKSMLCRLSVFAGGWAIESAEQVCSGGGIEEFEVLDLLGSLVDKSLVAFEETESPRYRLLETVRQYARDRLLESGFGETWRDRHLAHFVALAEKASPELVGADQKVWLSLLETEHENLRAALEWSQDDPAKHPAHLSLAASLQQFWHARAHFFEGRAHLARAIAQDSGEDPAARARALNGAAILAFAQADYPAALQANEESLAIRRATGDQNGVATSLNNLGSIAYYQGDFAGARARFEESLEIRRGIDDRRGVASSLNNLGLLLQKLDDPIPAKKYLLESLAMRREMGDRHAIGGSLQNLGVRAFLDGDWPGAQKYWEESLVVRREISDRVGIALTLQNLGRLALDQGDLASAYTLYEQRLALSKELGDAHGVLDSLEAIADVALHGEVFPRACRLWAAAERLREEIGAPLPPDQAVPREKEIARVRGVLGEAAFLAAWTEGRALSRDEAIALAATSAEAGTTAP